MAAHPMLEFATWGSGVESGGKSWLDHDGTQLSSATRSGPPTGIPPKRCGYSISRSARVERSTGFDSRPITRRSRADAPRRSGARNERRGRCERPRAAIRSSPPRERRGGFAPTPERPAPAQSACQAGNPTTEYARSESPRSASIAAAQRFASPSDRKAATTVDPVPVRKTRSGRMSWRERRA